VKKLDKMIDVSYIPSIRKIIQMRITIELEKMEQPIMLPVNYNYLVQSMLYNNITPSLSQFLHTEGYTYEKRSFKLFTFSRLQGKHRLISIKERKYLQFYSKVRLGISSHVDKFLSELAEHLVKKAVLKLGTIDVRVISINVHTQPKITEENTIAMLSPVTVYSTLKTADGKKKTYYYSPYEKEFSQLIQENLRKKQTILFGKKTKDEIQLKPNDKRRPKEIVTMYKRTVIKAWLGIFKLSGSQELIRIGYETGLGSKNPQGFGMFEILK